MEHYYNIQSNLVLDPIFKKKVTVKNQSITPLTYTVISADLPKALTKYAVDDNEYESQEEVDESQEEVAESQEEVAESILTPLHLDPPSGGTIRSAILNGDESRLLSFSLPKSISINSFKEKYERLDNSVIDYSGNSIGESHFIITEIIEGTMINLWWDLEQDKWEISTKKAVSGNYTYFKNPLVKIQKTFKEMFIDVVGDFEKAGFDEIANLSKNTFYSFVIKHPENHIVHSVLRPTLYLVAVYEKTSEWEVKYIPQTVFMKWNILPKSNIKFSPMIENTTTYDNIYSEIERRNVKTENAIAEFSKSSTSVESLNNINEENTNYTMGFMITDTKTGTRTKIENNIYKYLKELRGNHPSYKYKYYELIFTNRFAEFIYFFPQYTDLFMKFEEEFNTFVNSIYWYYVNKYILKNPDVSSGNIPYQYSFHINHLHYNVYLPFLKAGQKKKITRNFVYEYVWEMPIKSILYWLNYDLISQNKIKH